MRIALWTSLALIAFASNSLLCRMALAPGAIDPVSFTTLRLSSGAVVLAIALVATGGRAWRAGDWRSSIALFLYALPFSLAYVSIGAGTGALLLFAAVQITMITVGLRSGERPHRLEWCGLILAFVGLVVLVAPGWRAPSPLGAALMIGAGIAWGVYSLRGRSAPSPVAATAGNFLRAVPFACLASLLARDGVHLSAHGVVLALVSGAVTSGLGYVIWYAALRGLTAVRAALVQVAVPVLAAAGGVAWLHEPLALRLVLAAALVFAGVGTALLGRQAVPRLAARKLGAAR